MGITGNDLLKERRGSTNKDKNITGEELLKTKKIYQSVNVNNVDQKYFNSFVAEANKFLSSDVDKSSYNTWKELNTKADTISAWLYKNKSKLDKDAYNSIASITDKFRSATKGFSQFATEEDYIKSHIGWLDMESDVNSETASARKEYYQGNEDRIAQIESELPDYAHSWLPDFVEDIFLSEEEEAKRNEIKKIRAENTQYERSQKAVDDHYMPITNEVKQTASKRDYSNATREELEQNERELQQLLLDIELEGGYDVDEHGNIVGKNTTIFNPEPKIIRRADALTEAFLNNETDSYLNSLVQDKLGYFLTAREDGTMSDYTGSMQGNGYDTWEKVMQEGDTSGWKYLKDDEITIYYYKYATEGKESAYKFLEDMTTELTRRETQEMTDYINDAPLLEQIALNVASIPMNVFGGVTGVVENASNIIQGKDINPYSRAHMFSNTASAIRTDTAQDINDATGNVSLPWVGTTFGDVYQSIMSFGDSALASTIPGGHVLLGLNSATAEMKDLYERGASNEQMLAGGILAGAAEMAFEHYSIDKLKSIKNMDAKAAKNWFDVFVKGTIMGGVEASEEMATEIANTISEALVMGSQSDWVDFESFAKNVVNAGIGGFISGNIGGTIAAKMNNAQYNAKVKQHGQAIIDKGGVDTLKELALEMSGASKKTTNLANKVGQNASAKNVGRLSAHLEESISKQNRTDIENALVEKGLSKKDAKRVTEYIVSTEALTEEQIAEIEGNEKIKDTVTKLLNDPKSDINERGRNLLGARLGIDMKNAKVKANKSGELSMRNDIDVAEKVSKTGKTTAIITDENGKKSTAEITIDKNNPIAKVKYVGDERIVYLNTDHGTVESSKVKYSSKEEALLYESFVDMNPAFANAVIKNYDSSVPIQTYINGMREGMILYGMHNFQAVGKDISKNSFLASLSEADQAFALKLGRAYAKADAKNANNDLRRAIKNAAEKAKASEEASTSEAKQNKPKKGTVRFEEGAKEQTHKQHKRIISLAKHLASAIGIDIVFYDSRYTGKKAGQSANGYYDADADTIYLDLQNAKDDAKTIAYTLSHELVHFIKKWSPQKFNTFAEFLMEQYASHGVSASTLLKQKMVELNTTDADLAYEEMIADACETMLLDSNAVVKLMELRKSDLELFEKIKLHIHKILNNIREAYKKLGYQPTSDEAKALLGMTDVLEQFYSLFEEAAVEATQNYQALATENANKTVFGEASVDTGKTETGVKHQLKAHKTIGEASIAYNNRHGNVHKAILQVGVESMYEMAEAMLPYLEEEGILPPDIPGKTIFKNGSYGKTGENTTLCVRTLTYEDFKDRVAEKVGRPLTVSESLLVSQKIYDIATEPQCIYCYVAADRKAYDEYLGEYWKAMDKYIKAMRKGGDSEALYTEYLAGRKDTNQQRKRWSQWESIAKSGKDYISAKDLTTKRKRDGIIARKNAFSEQIKDAQRYAQSASWAKTVCDYRAYKGEILKMTSKFVDMLNSEYGLRMYSFSDYTPAFIVENMQMIIDASVKGLKSLAYTKDTDYVEIFASTGQAINVSCFAKWDAEKGTYVEDNRQGANWEKTKNLRKQYRNVGAVMVATNDAMVEWALKQDWVDVVIPYHIVKTGTTIANEYQWNNYTSESSDKSGNRAANIYPTEHNNDFATYSNLLKERGITPRFSRWFDKVASGELTEDQYMKLVNEVRLPASELSPVIPSFNLEAAKKSFGIDNEGKVIKGGFVDKGGYMGGWYRQGVDVNQEVMAVSEDIKAGKSSLDVEYGMSKAGKERVEERYKKQEKSSKGNIHYSLKVKHTNGTETIVNPYEVTREQVLEFMEMSRKGKLNNDTYFPVSRTTPKTLIWSIKEAAEKDQITVDDRPLAMQADKARQAQIDAKPVRKNGYDIRSHAMPAEKVLEVIENLDNPTAIIHQRNRTTIKEDKYGNKYLALLPDNFAIFVNLQDGKEYVAIVEFDATIAKDNIVVDGNGDKYHTTVTVFEPDVTRNGEPFDYIEYLLLRGDNQELDIIKENPNSEAAIRQTEATAPKKEFSDDSISHPNDSVKKNSENSQENSKIHQQRKKSASSQYAPTFYSQMGKVIDDIKMDKVGATSLVNYLKGKGIKHDEIKWSGIEAFLEGKKSVTKAELQEFLAGSQLEIAEEMSSMIPYDIIKDGDNYLVKHKNGLIIDTWEYTENPGDPELVGWMSEDTGDIVSSIEELYAYVSDSYDEIGTRWSQYRLEGGTNYRELVFKMPNSSYSNNAMRAHWGEDGEGILAHARIQDMTTADGKRMLFVEEIQSDWHNEGHQKGYTTNEYEDAVATADTLTFEYEEIGRAWSKYIASSEFNTDSAEVRKQKYEKHRLEEDAAMWRKIDAKKKVDALKEKGMGDVPDAPFRDTYHEYALKRLLRMAAEEGYDSIGWTPADIQSERWSASYAEGYRIEYDQDIPKFLRKYGKKWGATVGKSTLKGVETKEIYYDVNRREQYGSREAWEDEVKTNLVFQGMPARDVRYVKFKEEGDYLIAYGKDGTEYDRAEIQRSGDSVWSMDITESMEQSVLYEGQPKFQKKKLSNRTILANALESAIDTSTQEGQNELKWLKDYQGKIALIEKEEAHLAEVNAEIKEISFTKGSDRSKLKDLNDDKTRTANRIHTYDRQLLRLEAMKPVKDVLAREKELVRKRTEEKGREALDAYREKMTKTQRELLTRYQESRKKGIEGRNKTEMRHKIKDVVNELNQYLTKGTKDKHVPIELQKAVAEALNAVNMDTVSAEERIAKKRAEMMKAKSPEVVERLAKEIEHIQEMGGNMAKKISRLKTAYDSIINSDDPLVANSHDEVISNSIGRVMEVVGDTPLRDMSLYQLEAVYDMYKMVLTTIRNANKAFKTQKSEEISVIANRVMEEIDKLGKKRLLETKASQLASRFDWNNLKPVYAFERIGSDTFTEVFNNVRAGEDTWAVDITEAKEFSEAQHSKFNYASWDFSKRFGFTSTSGMHFELSLDQIMSLYAYSKREQAKEHLKRGGIVFDETTEVTVKTKLGIPVKFNPTQATAYNISDETLVNIIGKLTAEQREFVDVMQDYLSTTMGEKGNEVSLALYGVKLYKEKNYFPLKSATQFMAKAKEQLKGEVKIKNSGFSKETTPNASNPIVLTPFMDVWASHVNEMSMYHAFVLPLEDFYRVFNYKTPTSDTMATESVEMFLQNAYGKAATQYIDQLLKDLNGGARVDSTVGDINKLIGLFKKSAVFASASVVIQQPSSIARATALVDSKYFVGKPTKGKHKDTWAEVKKYAPVAIIKEMGYFDTGMGQSTVEWLKGEKTLGDKIDDIASKAPALADEYAWCAIWNAVKRETLHTQPKLRPNSEEFLKAVGERFTEVITKTQVYDSVLARSANMRSKDMGMKMVTAFMGEPTTSLNMLENALIQGKRGNIRYARKAIGSVVASMILNSILVSIVYAGRDDDEDKTYAEKYIGTFTEELLDSLNPLTLVPIVKDIVSIVQGYDVERSDMAVITDLVNAWNNLDSDNRSVYRKVEDFGGAIASLLGLPVKNIMRDVRGMYNTINSFINGEKTTGAGIKYAVKSSAPKWLGGGETSNGQQLYEAIVSGDSEQIERVMGRFENQDDANSAFRKVLKEKYQSGEVSRSEAIDLLINYGGYDEDFDEDDAYWRLEEWDFGIESEDDYSKYADFYEAVKTGKNIKAVIREYTDHGVEAKTLASQITKYYKPLYKEMTNAERARIKGYLLNAYELLGYDRSKKSKDIDKWLED